MRGEWQGWQARQQGCAGGQQLGLLLNQATCSLFIFAHGFLLKAASEYWAEGSLRRSLSYTPYFPFSSEAGSERDSQDFAESRELRRHAGCRYPQSKRTRWRRQEV
jgi:hypothetical protein